MGKILYLHTVFVLTRLRIHVNNNEYVPIEPKNDADILSSAMNSWAANKSVEQYTSQSLIDTGDLEL